MKKSFTAQLFCILNTDHNLSHTHTHNQIQFSPRFIFVFQCSRLKERQFLVASILVEFLVSTIFYLMRSIYLDAWGPGTIFLLLFIRSQISNTLTLALIFLPKLWYQHKQVSEYVAKHNGLCSKARAETRITIVRSSYSFGLVHTLSLSCSGHIWCGQLINSIDLIVAY